MNDRIERIVSLLHKSINGVALTPEEQTDLENWISNSEDNRRLYNEVMDPQYMKREIRSMQSIDSKSLWRKIAARLPQEEGKVVSIARNRYARYVAAAVIIILLGLTAFFVFNNNHQTTNEQVTSNHQPQTPDIAPGTDGAILTLSDGKQIVLDNTGKGEIAQEGNARVIKSEDGQLVYQSSGQNHPGETRFNTVSTQKGKQYRIVLPDGSKVWLNSESSIHYPATFSGSDRRVTITGELYFEIAKDKARPFKVNIASSLQGGESRGEVEVLGTHFNINSYADEATINTTVLEGLVKVSKDKKNTFVKPGQQARITTNGEIKTVNEVDLEQTMAWKNGFFVFKKDDLETIMRQISRWYGAEISFADKIPGHFVVTVRRDQPVSELLKKLEMTKDVRFEINGTKIIVKK